VIDQLSAARGELDVILDLITAVEQQQFMSLAHVPRARDPAATARNAALRLARRRAQLRAAADRLRAGTAAAAAQSRVADRFLSDVAALRARWRLGRRPATAGGAFFVDLALPLPRDLLVVAELQRPEQTQVNIVPSAEGEACLVVAAATAVSAAAPAAPAAVEVIKGPAAIDAELERRQMAHAWRVIEGLVAAEAAAQGRRDGSGSAAAAASEAVRRMAAAAAAKASASSTDDMDVDGAGDTLQPGPPLVSGAGGGLAAADLAAFCVAPGCQEQFEARALRLLAVLCRSARTPTLIKEAQSGFGGDSSGGGSKGVLEQLVAWLRHAALCRAVETTLAQQGATGERQSVPGELTAAWALSAGGRPLGTLEVAKDRLLWRGQPLPGVAGPQLGRRQLDTLITAAQAAADA
jgi:hypothetical protein